jgi:hypothetical protein
MSKTSADVQTVIVKSISDIRTKNPNYSHHDLCVVTAMMIVKEFLGLDWMQRHVTGTGAPTDFFKNDWSTEARANMHKLRLIYLAEFLINLQFVPNFKELLAKFKENDLIEATFAELEVGRIIFLNRVPFRFVRATGKKKSDYDLELCVGGIATAADTKCKLETTSRSVDTVLGSLKAARSQLPDDKPGMIFVKVPQTWNPSGTDDGILKDMREISDAFFIGRGAYKGTKHVVAVNFYLSLALEFDPGTFGVMLCQCFINEVVPVI